MTTQPTAAETKRLEELWAGEFGNAYIERNKDAGKGREKFWNEFLKEYAVERVLEVGCNVGLNLQCIIAHVSPGNIYGIDINPHSLQILRERLPGVHAIHNAAKELPFESGFFDLAFTAGVLIHQPEESLPGIMKEIVRCSRRYVLCMEYFAEQTVEVPYRDQTGALFKRDYGRLYQERFPALTLRTKGFLSKGDGWDDITYWLFEKP
jgi:pseudaminic acid biosynthesis-associated methylase